MFHLRLLQFAVIILLASIILKGMDKMKDWVGDYFEAEYKLVVLESPGLETDPDLMLNQFRITSKVSFDLES